MIATAWDNCGTNATIGNDKDSQQTLKALVVLVPGGRLELPLSCEKRILSPQRLPIPPPGRDEAKMEARVGIENLPEHQ